MPTNSIHYTTGTEKNIAVVLSCPGQDEEKALPPSPAKGQTGKNLKTLITILHDTYGKNEFTIDKITITNSWAQVEYPDKTGRSEAKISEVLEDSNLERLSSEICDIEKIIICCGVNANAAVSQIKNSGELKLGVQVVQLAHLGNQAINSKIRTSLDGNKIVSYSKSSQKPAGEKRTLKKIKEDNRILRLKVVAKNLNDQMQDS